MLGGWQQVVAQVAHGDNDGSAPIKERSCGFEAEAGRGAGDKNGVHESSMRSEVAIGAPLMQAASRRP